MGQLPSIELLPEYFSGCLICGVDSKPVIWLFASVIGGLTAASLCVLFWGVLTKKFKDDPKMNFGALEAEGLETESKNPSYHQ